MRRLFKVEIFMTEQAKQIGAMLNIVHNIRAYYIMILDTKNTNSAHSAA